ncbi:MAG: zinc ribbon domain-containing protein, partial [Anaerovoracaceae bacterium]
VLSGLLVCAECGSNYRRITRANGEIVWRCSDRVEKGKQSTCKLAPTVADVAIKELICKELGLAKFDEQATQDNISQVLIATDSTIDIVRKFEMILQL